MEKWKNVKLLQWQLSASGWLAGCWKPWGLFCAAAPFSPFSNSNWRTPACAGLHKGRKWVKGAKITRFAWNGRKITRFACNGRLFVRWFFEDLDLTCARIDFGQTVSNTRLDFGNISVYVQNVIFYLGPVHVLQILTAASVLHNSWEDLIRW